LVEPWSAIEQLPRPHLDWRRQGSRKIRHSMTFEQLGEMTLRLFAAACCGAVVGWEREARNKAAGLKTLTLVALGAAAFTQVGVYFYQVNGQADSALDATRIIAGVMQGIGFLGAGAILQSRGSVRGLTTAATIWIAGGLGTACGFGAYAIAIVTVLLALLTLVMLSSLEDRYLRREASVAPSASGAQADKPVDSSDEE
jgi:putative Mg2+ transporter-C (MgtC) family protein